MARRTYKFTDKKHTRQGMVSTGLGVSSLLLLCVAFGMAFKSAGTAGSFAGLWGAFSMVGAAVGFVLGVRGFQEEDVYYLFSQLGIELNGILFILWTLIFIIGM